ncbi:hypothetical protein [Shewanella algae]|uniref:hypothetical protein n=1 Tax=Shewanella algae TaxID=38313 RepID=UPI0031F56D1A
MTAQRKVLIGKGKDYSKPALKTSDSVEGEETERFNMNNMPAVFKKRFTQAKEAGLVTGTFTAFVRQAVLEKLNNDNL